MAEDSWYEFLKIVEVLGAYAVVGIFLVCIMWKGK